MNQRVFAGLDVGSSSLKYSLIDADTGAVVLNGKRGYDDPGALGRRPALVYESAVAATLEELSASFEIVSTALSTQMYSLLERSSDGLLVHQWNSSWSAASASLAPEERVKSELFSVSGCPDGILFPARKLSRIPRGARARFLPWGIKEYLLERLTGVLTSDYTTASASGFLDVHTGSWNAGLIAAMGFDPERFPRIQAHNEGIGPVVPGPCASAGLVAPGLGDGPSASYACREISSTCGNLGTSTAVRRIAESLEGAQAESLWRFRLSATHYVYGAISANGCGIIDWSKSKLQSSGASSLLGATDPLFFPWMNGEFSPFWNADARGVYWGISPGATPELFHSAVIEGVAFAVALMIDLVCAQPPATDRVVFGGGGINNARLLETIGAVVPQELVLLEDSEHLVSIGAAISAAEACGERVDYRPDARNLPASHNPVPAERYHRWRELAARLQAEMSQAGAGKMHGQGPS
ncbi:MAG: hypothetical protein EA403_13975 [Spirochaetaceae bacterium]|nr:MAG: hypothetical protein EA403_13975 [Spirochaetaceae bacterium]